MTIIFDGQLEIDCNRGVIYFHKKSNDTTLLRICNLPPLRDEITSFDGGMLDIRYIVGRCSWKKNNPELELDNNIKKFAAEYTPISKTIVSSIWLYLSKRELSGNFLRSCLENNLSKAISNADEHSLDTINLIVKLLFNHTPAICWGSKEKVEKWLDPVNPSAPELKIDEHEMKIFEYLLNR